MSVSQARGSPWRISWISRRSLSDDMAVGPWGANLRPLYDTRRKPSNGRALGQARLPLVARSHNLGPAPNDTPAEAVPVKLGLINSAWAQAGRDTAFGIRMTKEIGFDTIDIFAD